MSYWALVDTNNIVQQVIVADEEYIQTHLLAGESWLMTDSHTLENVHYGPDWQPDGLPPYRGNFASIGYTWDPTNQVFYAPQPYPSWILDTNTWCWGPPVPYPEDGKVYVWDEQTQSWVLKPQGE